MASGDHRGTGRKPTGKKAAPLSQKEQSRRFVEMAKELEADETGGDFERAAGILLKSKKKPEDPSKT